MNGNSERKRQVVIGDLPSDFLRFENQVQGTSVVAPNQIDLDEQAAGNLHHELNIAGTGIKQPVAQQYAVGGGGFVPPNSRGRLSICLVQAKLTKNYGFVKMDPYCRVRVGNTVFETPTDAGGGKTPHWNRTVYWRMSAFIVRPIKMEEIAFKRAKEVNDLIRVSYKSYLPQGIESIYLEIFDERAFTTDERVAWNSIIIPAAVFNGETIDDWYSLSGQQGDAKEGMVNIVFTLHPIATPQVAYVPLTQMTPPNVILPGSMQNTVVSHSISRVNEHPQQMQVPLFAESDVNELKQLFPDMDMEVIRSVMYEKRGNKEAAANALLTIAAEGSPLEAPVNENQLHSGGLQNREQESPVCDSYVSERMGAAEATKLDEEYHELERKVDITNALVEDFLVKTREYLQPNPATRAKMATTATISKLRGTVVTLPYPHSEGVLGDAMLKHGKALGDDSNFGRALIDAGEAYKMMADVKYALEDNVKQNFLDPLTHLQNNDLKEVAHHRKKLQGRRLDYDCKKRKQKDAAFSPMVDEEIRQAEEKLEESKRLAETAMFNVLDNDVEQISQLWAFVEAQLDFHRHTAQILEGLSDKLKQRIQQAANRPKQHHIPKPVLSE